MKLDDYHIQVPGRIVEYFPATQTATVIVSNNRTYSTSEFDEEQVTPGEIRDVPVFTPGGGNWHLTFPVKTGDTCLLMFSQFGYDHWFVTNKDAAGKASDGRPQPWTYRRFDLADGFAQVGWNNLPTAIQDYSPTNTELRNFDRGQRIELNADESILIFARGTEIKLTPAGDVTIKTATKTVVDTPLVEMTGNLTVAGSITATGEVAGNGIVLSTHVHAGDGGSGSGPDTGPPL